MSTDEPAASDNPAETRRYRTRPFSEDPLLARQAALISWSRTADRAERTEPARIAAEKRWEAKVDPDGVMSPTARAQAADAARRAHYLGMARKSAQVRKAKAKARRT